MSKSPPPGERLILASKSPRRKELLGRITPDFECINLDVPEFKEHPEGSAQLAKANALLKAKAVAELHPDAWILGSDTVVSLENKSLGKPVDHEDAFQMIRSLSGKNHQVYTGVSMINLDKGIEDTFVDESEVRFFGLTDAQIEDYIQRVDTTEYAGGYPIQHVMGSIVAGFSGSYSNIVGLPVEMLTVRFKNYGLI